MVAVIHLKEEHSNDIEVLFCYHTDRNLVFKECVLPIFSEDVILFFNEFSKKLKEHPDTRLYPDLSTFAFFCRKSNLSKLQRDGGYFHNNHIGRGITFHIAPSNVPLNFAYSFLMGMLSGNINIVRLPSKNFKQIEIFIEVLNTFLHQKDFKNVLSKIFLIKYERNKNVTDFFSSICDNRVIWGGDATINEIRTSLMHPRSYDITFSDRYSFCILNANAVVECQNIKQLALDFYNDTYLFDQNACTSPHLVLWLGDEYQLDKAKSVFWDAVNNVLKIKGYSIEASSVVDKLIYAHERAISGEINSFANLNNALFLTELNQLDESIASSHSNCGYFNNYYIKNLNELVNLVNSPKYQTITYYGVSSDTVKNIIFENGLKGIDRIVPVGKASDFSTSWDGCDIIYSLSRFVKVI